MWRELDRGIGWVASDWGRSVQPGKWIQAFRPIAGALARRCRFTSQRVASSRARFLASRISRYPGAALKRVRSSRSVIVRSCSSVMVVSYDLFQLAMPADW